MVTSPQPVPHRLAHQVRERFVDALDSLIGELGGLIEEQLTIAARGGLRDLSMAELQMAHEAGASFQRERQAWVAAARQGWREALSEMHDTGASQTMALGLVDDEVVERKIIASRLGAAVNDAAGSEFNALRLRIQRLERSRDLVARDVLRPETLAQKLLKAWTDCGLSRPMWTLVHGGVQEAMVKRMTAAYEQANAYLIEQGVMAEIDLKSLVRRTEDSGGGGGDAAPTPAPGRPGTVPPTRPGGATGTQAGAMPQQAGWGGGQRGMPAATRAGASMSGHYPGAMAGAGGMSTMGAHSAMGATEFPTVSATALARAAQETRMLTAGTPLVRVRQRAQGVLGQLRRLLSDRVADFGIGTVPSGPLSPQLARALAEPVTPFAVTELMDSHGGGLTRTVPMADVAVVATRLRQRAAELKEKAEKPSEKAIIEIVALMFQAILAEERIPASIRVWFARLQIPVLRLALAEPDFFASVQHPARQLIDRMGACVLGFDASAITGSRLEREIKRIVQVVEQYPETGRRVYQLVLDEFKKFLGRSLTESGGAQQAATLAQQVEQKEALAIQYTIELRRMLAQVPVADEVREFLFRVWSEVLALAAVRRGPQAPETLRFKQAAADLLWAVSPKLDRGERSQVVQQLSALLQTLREGMGTLGLKAADQDTHIKQVNDAVMRAFVSRGEGLSPSKLAELSHGLAGLEDVVTDDPEGDVLLDPSVIELMFGVEGDGLEVIASGGSLPTEGMLHWAQQLELGAWFALDHHGEVVQVQYAWRSRRGQLHLFSAGPTRNFLVQTRRLASYLQAGLLVPVEDEALTIRATREALSKLNAEPDRLLH